MAEYGPGFVLGSLTAGAPVRQFRVVSLDLSGRVFESTGTSYEMQIGTSQQPACVGEAVAVVFTGVGACETATSFSSGTPLVSDGEGRVTSWIDSLSPVVGVALGDSPGAGVVVRVLVTLRPSPIYDSEPIAISPDRYPVAP